MLRRIIYKTAYLKRYFSRHRFVFGEDRTFLKIFNFFLIELEDYFKRKRVYGMPYSIFLDPVNICPLKCPLCTTGLRQHTRKQRMLTLDEFKQLLNPLVPYLYTLKLYNYGEPFLNPALPEMIAFARSKKIYTQVNSNLNKLTKEMAEKTVSAGLNNLVVSFDGVTQKAYGAYRVSGDIEIVKNNISRLSQIKKDLGVNRPTITLQFLINRHNEQEIEATRKFAKENNAEFFPSPIMLNIRDKSQREEWLPLNDTLTHYDKKKLIKQKSSPETKCGFLWNDPVINVDGGVAPCCHLFHKSMDYGNLHNASFKEIWNNHQFQTSRQIFKDKRIGGHSMACERCVNVKGFIDADEDLINENITNTMK